MQLLFGVIGYEGFAQQLIRYTCPTATSSTLNNDKTAPRADSECFEGQTEMRVRVSDESVGTATVRRLDDNGRPFRAQVDISWKKTGVITVDVEYKRYLSHIEGKWWKRIIFLGWYVVCDGTDWDKLYTYTVHHDYHSAVGTFVGKKVAYVPNDNTQTIFSLLYTPDPSVPTTSVRASRIKYYNGKDADTVNQSINEPVLYYATGKNDYQLRTEVLTEYLDGGNTCSRWVTVTPVTLSVISSCFLDDISRITIKPTATNAIDTVRYYEKPDAYGLSPGKKYVLSVRGLQADHFYDNYKFNFQDFGNQNLQLVDSFFTIPSALNKGSYRITINANVKDCPAPNDIPILVGVENKRIDQTCTITLPQDLKEWFREFTPNDSVLQHVATYVNSERSIILNPGVILELGAELFLEYPASIPDKKDADSTMNFIEQTGYDEYGRVVAASRSYFDNQGISLQSQSKNLSAEVILANATLYDTYGRPAISTLSAPVQISKAVASECPSDDQVGSLINFKYKPDFVNATANQVYSYKHFDIIDASHTNELSPVAVDATKAETLGWYYSSNNTLEPSVATTQFPYSRTLYLHDGSGAVKGVTKPGNAFKAGSSYLATSDQEPVSADDPYFNLDYNSYLSIRKNELGFNVPVTIENAFFKTVAKDESGKKSVTYTDKSGHAIIALYFGDQADPITKSFNFYDNAGRMLVNISPNGMKQYTGSNFAIIDKTTYTYDSKGRVVKVAEKIAGGDAPDGISTSEYVYRKDGNIRFSQNEEQRRASPPRYSYTNYDNSGRPIESGEYSMLSDTIGIIFKSNEMINVVETTNSNGGLPEVGDSEATTTNIGIKKERTYTYYDEPDPLIPVNTDLNISRNQHFVNGAVSRTKKVNYNADLLQQEDHVISWYSYDERGRVEWIVQEITGLGVKTIDYRYGSTGQVQEVVYQKGHDADYVNGTKDQFTHFYEYDADGRLKKVYTGRELLVFDVEGKIINAGVTYNLNGKGEIDKPGMLELKATYYYYMHGPLKRVELANRLQGIDYVYTADGALKGINNASASIMPDPITNKIKDPGQDGNGNGFRSDVFGMTLDYYQNDFVSADGNAGASVIIPGNSDLYDGLIKAARWHSPTESGKQFAYAYKYDSRNQFKQADWGEVNNSNVFTGSTDYMEAIGTNSNNPLDGYDANGNITSLKRNAEDGIPIADFSYNYRTNTNILESITQGNETFRTYEYDNLGRTLKEQEGDKSKFITYDVTGKVTGVYADNAHTQPLTTFVYDDKGFRLNKTTYDTIKTSEDTLYVALLRTWYVRDASGNIISTYEQFLRGPQPVKLTEVPVYGSGRIGMYNRAGIMLYELSDHLGNVRAVIGDTLHAEYLATMETELADKEGEGLNGYGFQIRKRSGPAIANHTPPKIVVDGHTYDVASPNEVTRLNNVPNGSVSPDPIGTSIMLMVHPGDVISADVYAKYKFDGTVDHNAIVSLAGFFSSALTATNAVDGALVNVVGSSEYTSPMVWSKYNDDQPRAFLNYLLFDNNFKLQKFDFDQVTEAARIPSINPDLHQHEHLMLENITIQKEGFIYIYVSNETNQDMEVYFDDLKVTHTFSDIVAGGDFYPYGLAITDRQINRDPYRHGYQGKFSEKDDETSWNHFELREYDAVIGRWLQNDPAGQYYSPYVGMGNNPVVRTDIDGGVDDYRLNDDNSLTLKARTDDKFNRYFNSDDKLIYQTNWTSKDVATAISGYGSTSPANDWLNDFRQLNRAFGADMPQNNKVIQNMYERAEQLGWDYQPLVVLGIGALQAKEADRVDIVKSLFFLKPPTYRPGAKGIVENIIKFETGVPANKYLKYQVKRSPAEAKSEWQNIKSSFYQGTYQWSKWTK